MLEDTKQATRACTRIRAKATVGVFPSGIRDPSGAFKYTEWYYLRALDTPGAADSSVQNNTCPLSPPSSLSRARRIEPTIAFRGVAEPGRI